MHIHIFQHVPFEGPAYIKTWLEARGHRLSYTRFYDAGKLPDAAETDLLIILGGPMGVHDAQEFPWLKDEIAFVERFITSGKPVLGICLGAQIIAAALGARVYPGPQKEIGWFPLRAVTQDDAGLFRFPDNETVFHWHGDTFDLPEGAARLAETEGCPNQAFQVGKRVMGLQFHLEVTPEAVEKMVNHGRHELTDAKYIQSEAQILAASEANYEKLNEQMARVLEYLMEASS